MVQKIIPKSKYATIYYQGTIHNIEKVFDYYNNEWLPNSEYIEPDESYEIEYYDSERFLGNENSNSEIIFLLPIVRK
ncbi:GyrI-like domain-containing protein [Brevibacillus daliensis]|uniref:GyrI-like domain-containing protein n=1 Tax=Brevibacillus daliensis TaxID=2892995 RepID=UPI001E36F216|nr:GyrI-like domain-containing protein [Brevibacillus daliensis]